MVKAVNSSEKRFSTYLIKNTNLLWELNFANFGPNREIKFPQNFSNAKNKGQIIHRTALIFFQVKNMQNIQKICRPQKLVPTIVPYHV